MIFKLDPAADPDKLFFALRGIKLDTDTYDLVAPLRCHWLTEHNSCRIYSMRPQSCKVYECEHLKELTKISQLHGKT